MLSSSSAVCTTDALRTEKYIILAPERPSKKKSTKNKKRSKRVDDPMLALCIESATMSTQLLLKS